MLAKFRKGIILLVLGFFALFSLRLTHDYVYRTSHLPQTSSVESLFDFAHKNYASEKLKMENKQDNQTYSVDQKYEKIAAAASQTQNFETDEQQVRALTKKYNALIQYEQNVGLKGARRLHLAIGVPPAEFEHMVEEIKSIGQLISLHIDKADKTNEYKDLNAKRLSLEKTRKALGDLKGHSGSIQEQIELENRILEIESQIQGLGVKLGEYDQENEFCTIKFGLQETKTTVSKFSVIQGIKPALEWTIKYYVALLAIFCFGSLAILISIIILERLKWLPIVVTNYMKTQE